MVCGTAGPGVAHLFNGLMDARKEGAPIIAIAGDVETSVIDTAGLEELNPYLFFDAAALYIGRVVRLLRNSKSSTRFERDPTSTAFRGCLPRVSCRKVMLWVSLRMGRMFRIRAGRDLPAHPNPKRALEPPRRGYQAVARS